ncbi:hypothetical protein [Spirochaeta cellobiosiphila]|uniref:hypothetical protein n=1 Tax=Spirochaeta cellobiosiphila TaxID=504483 RepID=UPI00040E8B81|nr:hypothetical protein [Spirochaeta cellobiosiphila]
MENILDKLKTLINIPSPTGMTDQAANYIYNWAKQKNLDVQKLHKGSVIVTLKAEKAVKEPLILASHIDTLGAMVSGVSDYIELTPIGGYPANYILGNYCSIHTDKKIFKGTILPKNPAVHVNSKLKDHVLKFSDLQVRVDYLPQEGELLKELILPGDFISLDPAFDIQEGFVKSRHLDDKASAAVMMALIEEFSPYKSDRDIYFYFNVTEETGQGFAILPHTADMIVVDMGVVGEGCEGKETHVSICAKDSTGPFNYGLTKELKAAAIAHNVDYVVDIFPFYGSDGQSALGAGKDYRVALVGPGVNASHGWERTHIRGIEQTYKILRAYIL